MTEFIKIWVVDGPDEARVSLELFQRCYRRATKLTRNPQEAEDLAMNVVLDSHKDLVRVCFQVPIEGARSKACYTALAPEAAWEVHAGNANRKLGQVWALFLQSKKAEQQLESVENLQAKDIRSEQRAIVNLLIQRLSPVKQAVLWTLGLSLEENPTFDLDWNAWHIHPGDLKKAIPDRLSNWNFDHSNSKQAPESRHILQELRNMNWKDN